jgi:hypothetical protein
LGCCAGGERGGDNYFTELPFLAFSEPVELVEYLRTCDGRQPLTATLVSWDKGLFDLPEREIKAETFSKSEVAGTKSRNQAK